MASEEHVLDLIPAYALDILDEQEQLQVAEHLASCESCRAELAPYQEVVDDLPLGMAISEPPAGLKEKVMAGAKKDTAPEQEPLASSWWGRFTQSLRGAPAWGLASLVLILVLGASNLFLWGRLSALEQTGHGDFISVSFDGTQAATSATGLLVISPDGEYGTLVVDGLPYLDESQQYQLWLIDDGQRNDGGVFSVNEEGYGFLEVESARHLINYSQFGITIEPAGGSPGPTGEKVLGGQF
jgi:anti-sigma-K factor RskA